MNRACLVAATLVSLSGTASAGYIGLGIGSAPAIDDDEGRIGPAGRSGKLLVGSRWGRLSIEGALGGHDVTWINQTSGIREPYGELRQLSVAAKLNLPLGDNFEAFGRFGLAQTWINATEIDETWDASGSGFLAALGVEYKIDVGVAGASLFFDYQINHTELVGDRTETETSFRMFSIGATVGF